MHRSIHGVAIALTLLCATVAGADDRFFDSDGVRIRYIDRGAGEPIVLVHGFSRNIELSWADTGIIDALEPQFRVLALDCRGHGRSDKPQAGDAYGLEMVHDVARLLDELDIEGAHIVGYSMGGRIALKFAAEHGDRTRSVTLIGSGGALSDSDFTLFDTVAESLENGRGIAPLLEFIWPAIDEAQRRTQMDQANQQTMDANDVQALAHVARGYRQWVVSDEQLKRINAPVRVIIGSDDPFRSAARTFERKRPGVDVIEIAGGDHLTTLTREEVKAALRRPAKRDSANGASRSGEHNSGSAGDSHPDRHG